MSDPPILASRSDLLLFGFFLLKDNREASRTHPKPGLPGGGDAVSVPRSWVCVCDLCLPHDPLQTILAQVECLSVQKNMYSLCLENQHVKEQVRLAPFSI